MLGILNQGTTGNYGMWGNCNAEKFNGTKWGKAKQNFVKINTTTFIVHTTTFIVHTTTFIVHIVPAQVGVGAA